ncbi:FAD-dependent oxidoreductase [uncultured Vibrio sp.]|uniref:FAD-dependent oxidoreductase n=1 Tax=uncultured Vibrio sp. TaxID=114054 RepID=UPI0025FA8719|nr:FAD-dependent oxidoreductase [uncultured Vibrio sp.]
MKVAIVGAGWYGCHLALSLLQKNFDVKVFERSDRSISGASRYNQNRLHQGFHYPRDFETRKQSLEGFSWFTQHYGNLIKKVTNNIYGVANTKSNIDFETFKQIMTASNLKYTELGVNSILPNLENVQGMVSTDEMLIENFKASQYFDDILHKHITYNTYVDLSDESVLNEYKDAYDLVIDCTWGTTRLIPEIDYYYEPCIYFYYRKKTKLDFAFTLMDGGFFSVYPYENDIFTVTSVKNTPINQVNSREDVGKCFKKAKEEEFVSNKREAFEKEILFYYPGFLDDFEYVEPVYSLKTKLVSASDFRGCLVKREDNLISVFSGKIDTLHVAELEVNRIINEMGL